MEECDICGAKLDAGEKCDCLKEIKFVEMRWQQVSEEDEEGQMTIRMEQFIL